ncbi:MAG: LysR family transcriptional regulator [Actinobacteria bacterium]|nr:LysR family transcriptional regulator [Actinomycetota bacterium]MCA1721322.1 LysR family transcriptional regulator [Actinomycetota bacterium]
MTGRQGAAEPASPDRAIGTVSLELRELEAFVAVAEDRSFASAARRLGYDASTVSKHVRRLERDVGLVLLTRTARHVELTAHGGRFLPHARRTANAARRAAAFAAFLSSGSGTPGG